MADRYYWYRKLPRVGAAGCRIRRFRVKVKWRRNDPPRLVEVESRCWPLQAADVGKLFLFVFRGGHSFFGKLVGVRSPGMLDIRSPRNGRIETRAYGVQGLRRLAEMNYELFYCLDPASEREHRRSRKQGKARWR